MCFTCDEKWSCQHWCPNKYLQVLIVVNGIEIEIMDQSLVEVDEEIKTEESALMALSFNSFMGISSATTTKVMGSIHKNKVVVMLDRGATHNFISPTAVEKYKLLAHQNPNLNVLLGTGVSVQGMRVCRNVPMALSTMTFSADFIVLELGNVEIILGVQWSRTLGTTMVDWEKNEWFFCYKGKPVTITGDPQLHRVNVSVETLTAGVQNQNKGQR